MRRPLVAGNWKMNGTRSSVAELTRDLVRQVLPGSVDVAVFPSLIHLDMAMHALASGSISVGAQNCAEESGQGALTGEVSGGQLAEFGCRWVLVGHSERRLVMGESDAVVSRKFATVLASGMSPVLCLGETLEQRRSGKTLEVVLGQLCRIIEDHGVAVFANAVIAYEPVWAIGTGLTATPGQAQEVHAAIRGYLANEDAAVAEIARLLYGGSVKAENAAELFAMADIDGGLIGGASLKADEFGAICRAAGN
ncbi:triose-phosphate isomerase [Stutzerimonas kirkiae]|uniref:Triosephosphate isomerase n=1 Tax=Stutzerimonas kirkiae TaxID=2211392 RepID=A0A4Q9RDA3_9GAMM|nr:triose-phosphate isomerase [Stutzerimonas kirkiae]TBU97911.1 triose-phosphate isomerase [Stutzerimonas kirkiae]TBV04573.1 triose-phosphate isomerase [Stutzerimonas kirkiae]